MLKALSSLLGTKSPVFIWLVTQLQGHFVGSDQSGNRYFRAKPRSGYKRERRWVMYKDAPDSSTVPPEWHAWLHYQSDAVPGAEDRTHRQYWQRPHKPNLTGTPQAYRPPGHQLRGGNRQKGTGDYQAWTPPQ